jgi:glycosyltransferase involved in cell wall biosynthesis
LLVFEITFALRAKRLKKVRHEIIGIGWVPRSPRLLEIMEFLNGETFLLGMKIKKEYPSILKLFILSLETISLILKKRPKFVVAQNPPTPCILIVFLGMILFNKRGKLIIDSHALTLGMEEKSILWRLLSPIEMFVIKKAFLNTVTHEIYAKKLSQYGIKCLVLYDRPPKLVRKTETVGFNVICPLGGHEDEDIGLAIEAIKFVRGIKLIITGIMKIPFTEREGIHYTGLLTRQEYIQTLLKARVGLCPIRRNEMTLPYVTFEFMAAGIPFLVSNNQITRRMFDEVFLFSDKETLINKLEALKDEVIYHELVVKVEKLKVEMMNKSLKGQEKLVEIIKTVNNNHL